MRFICSDESINAYGYRVITAGIHCEKFLKNPVMLWNHSRSCGSKNDVLPIGYWQDLRIENNTLTAEAVFDAEDAFAQQIASKVEQGVVRACSIGIRVLETSAKEEDLLPGQSAETVTACELREISLCDIPANGNAVAVALYDEADRLIGLSELPQTILPIYSLNQKTMKEINKTLGLALDAGEEQAVAKIVSLKEQIAALEKEKQTAQEAALREMVNEAIRQRKTTDDKREMFMNIGRSMGVEVLRSVLGELSMPAKASEFIRPNAHGDADRTFSQYGAEELESMRLNDPQRYTALFAASYGFNPQID